ncbi:heme NO-binding domain-containing protein [Pseudooceanicola marinus]|uniref:heme NO-binding domain-containing protein n=1 Tax=Pseudooceanicola marinus TaxID=396013 RepID=UPI001CD591B3|nr:heme NO-binding domain-containing protein [Pseudooceanicola marinus]MCA1337039.1 heme NO-binding domain-containing protein [Pseudooceanicola marinus]
MHGLINRSLQCFLRDTYGAALWGDVVADADLPVAEFEAMLTYEDALTFRVLDAAEARLAKSRATLLEDLGTYLVSHPHNEGLRRLLRFAGVGYEDFLHSLDELPDRTRLAVSDLDLPQMELRQLSGNRYRITCSAYPPGFAHVLVGILRAMADDYGALVMLDHAGHHQQEEVIEVTLVESAFAEGRAFDLGARAG